MSRFICIEKKPSSFDWFRSGHDFMSIKESFKIDLSHYRKVLEAKFEKATLNDPCNLHVKFPVNCLKEGDFISCSFKTHWLNPHPGRKIQGYVQRDENGLFVYGWKTSSNGDYDGTFYSDKTYLKHVSNIEIMWREFAFADGNPFENKLTN